jgi:chromatin segregation and condensation protein Rec8/ScpA/Scc1 (kleisin family)
MLLLPSNIFNEEDEKEAADLELRLSLYKQFKAAERHLRNAWSGHEMFTRPFLRNIEPGFYLSQAILPEQLLLAVKKVYSDAAVFSPAAEKREISVESLEEKMRKLAERIGSVLRSSFSELTKDADRGELVVVFLALLHLLKDNAINIRQDDIFSEMIIEKV